MATEDDREEDDVSRNLWLARHGMREDSDPGWAQTAARPHDPGLAEPGFRQAAELAARLKGERIAHVFASPFLRTVQTAALAADALDLPVKLEHGFCEWLNPAWFSERPDLVPARVLADRFPRLEVGYVSKLVPPFPETTRGITERAGRAMRLVLAACEGDLLVVGHAATVMGVTQALARDPPRLACPLCSLTRLREDRGAWRVEAADDTSFLSGGAQSPCA